MRDEALGRDGGDLEGGADAHGGSGFYTGRWPGERAIPPRRSVM
jgi:hypothetical protein